MNIKITELINQIHSVKKQEEKEKLLESYINRERQDAYYQAKRKIENSY